MVYNGYNLNYSGNIVNDVCFSIGEIGTSVDENVKKLDILFQLFLDYAETALNVSTTISGDAVTTALSNVDESVGTFKTTVRLLQMQ